MIELESNFVSLQKKARLHKENREMTFQDMYDNQNLFDDEDDDSDWEPLEKPVEVLKWFCTNCTMVNFDDVVHCDVSYDLCFSHIISLFLFNAYLVFRSTL